MKNNEYLEKYGEKALQLYRRTKRQSQEHDDNIHNHIPKRNSSRKKSSSQKSLKHQKSKSKISCNQQPTFTFQKITHPKTKSKLIISGLSTPKNKIGKSSATHQQKKVSSSTKKKIAQDSISNKFKDILTKKSTKKMLMGVLECIQMISQHQQKLNQWLFYIKDIICHISQQAMNYRQKWKQQNTKTIKLQKQLEQLHKNLHIINNKNSNDKKTRTSEYAFLAQNQKLKEKMSKMQAKLRDYQRKQMVLISTLEHCNMMRNQQSDLPKIQKQFYQQQNNHGEQGYQESQQEDSGNLQDEQEEGGGQN